MTLKKKLQLHFSLDDPVRFRIAVKQCYEISVEYTKWWSAQS